MNDNVLCRLVNKTLIVKSGDDVLNDPDVLKFQGSFYDYAAVERRPVMQRFEKLKIIVDGFPIVSIERWLRRREFKAKVQLGLIDLGGEG